MLVPDAQLISWRRCLPAIRKAIDDASPDVILTTSPQHSIHMVGTRLKRDLSIRWVADYRDPHLLDERFRPRGVAALTLPLHRRFERRIYANADAILHAIPLHARWARMAYPQARSKIRILRHVIPQSLSKATPVASGHGPRSIRVVGTFGPDLLPLLCGAVADLNAAADNPGFELVFVGKPPEISPDDRERLGERLRVLGRVSHDEARKLVSGADVLVNGLGADRSRMILVSSKLIEFAASGRPIIEINPTRPNRQLLRLLGDAAVLHQPNRDALREAIVAALSRAAPLAEGTREAFEDLYGTHRHLMILESALRSACEAA